MHTYLCIHTYIYCGVCFCEGERTSGGVCPFAAAVRGCPNQAACPRSLWPVTPPRGRGGLETGSLTPGRYLTFSWSCHPTQPRQ